MKMNRRNNWLKAFTAFFSVLLFTSCSVDEWRSKKALAKLEVEGLTVQALSDSIRSHNTEVATLLVQAGTLKNATEEEKSQILMDAIQEDQPRLLHTLIQQGFTFPYAAKAAAVTRAIQLNQLGNVNTLAKSGFPKEITMPATQQTPVAWCISEHRQAMARLLVSNAFPLNESHGKVQPLEVALSTEQPSWMLRDLISHGANTNFKTSIKQTPFIQEVILTRSENDLLSALAVDTDLEALDPNGKAALFKAIAIGDTKKVELLISYGAEVQYIDSERNTYIQANQHFSGSPDITQLLLDKGADAQNVNAKKLNALDLALVNRHIDSGKILIKQGVKPSPSTFDTVYDDKNEKAVALLIQSALVAANKVISTGDTLLIDSIKQKSLEMVNALLEQGADPNLTGLDKEPPLSYALALQHYKIIETLLQAGAEAEYNFQSPNTERFLELIETDGLAGWFIKRDKGINPLMMACDQGHLKIVKLLRKHGAKNRPSKRYRFWPGNFAARRSVTDVVQYMVGAEPGNRDRTVLVDLSRQRATVYGKDKKVVMAFTVSSGKKGYRTKTGEFVVTNKSRHHTSSLYGSEMPYFQRLSYGDFGFHTGYVPGYAASHGCIRCPNSYAYKLFNYLKVGDVVKIQP